MAEKRGLLYYYPVWRVRFYWWNDSDDGEITEYIAAESAQDACAFVMGFDHQKRSIQSVDKMLSIEITQAVINKLVETDRRSEV